MKRDSEKQLQKEEVSEGAPTNSEGTPTNSEGAPTNNEGAPTNSEVKKENGEQEEEVILLEGEKESEEESGIRQRKVHVEQKED